jgi:hypothetical protein
VKYDGSTTVFSLNMYDNWFCRKFSFAAICGMISLHDQPYIMRERDDGNQF